MFEENLFLIIGAVVVLFLLWIIVGIRHLKYLKKEVTDQWKLIDESLRRRSDLTPNLIENVRRFTNKEEQLIEQVIAQRTLAEKDSNPGEEKIEYEYDLTHGINDLFNLKTKYPELASDTNYLELRKEIDDLETNVEDKTNKYNEMVRYYNTHRNMTILRPLAWIFSYKMINIFEVEK